MSGGNQVISHKSLTTDRLKLTLPEKNKGRYISYLSNENAPLYVQTPVLTVAQVSDESISFVAGKSTPFIDNLCKLDTFIVDTVAKRTTDFFAGKRFSRDWIAGRYVSRMHDDGDSPHVNVNFCLPQQKEELLIKDQRGLDRTLAHLKPGMRCIVILHLPGVSFTKASIKADFVAVQMKIYVEDTIPWSITDADSDEEINAGSDEDEATIDDDEVDAEVSALKLAALGIKGPNDEDCVFISSESDKNDDGEDLPFPS